MRVRRVARCITAVLMQDSDYIRETQFIGNIFFLCFLYCCVLYCVGSGECRDRRERGGRSVGIVGNGVGGVKGW